MLNGIYAITTLLSVVLPNKTSEAKRQLSVENISLEQINNPSKFDEITVQKGETLFERIK